MFHCGNDSAGHAVYEDLLERITTIFYSFLKTFKMVKLHLPVSVVPQPDTTILFPSRLRF